MKKLIPFLLLIGICLIFFYKTLLLGHIPFPGDLLVSGYAPWNHESYAGYVAGAVPSKDQYFDVLRELYPWKTVVISELKQRKFPLWNPFSFSGAPLLANYQSQVFYPLTILYFVLPQIFAWTVMVVIQPVLGSIFMYLFATEIGLTSGAALLAAILFNFSSFANVWMEFTTVWHTILWLPLLLYLIERGVKQKSLSLFQQILFVFGLYSAITGGHPQDFINSFLFLLVYTMLRVPRILWSQFLFIFVIPFFIAAPQIFPTIELFRNSARVAHDYLGVINNMLVQWWQLPLMAVVDFFGNPATKSNVTGDYVGKTLSIGVVGFFLAISSLWTKHSWHQKFFMTAAGGILLLTVRTPLTELLYRYPWPILSTGTPTRILFLLMLALSILAGFGFDAIQKTKQLPKILLISAWAFFLILWIVAPIKRPMILSGAILGMFTVVVVLSRYKKVLLYALIPIAIGELLYSFIKFNPFVPKQFVFPENKIVTELQNISGIDRFWGYGTAAVEANFATQTGLYSPDGTDPLNLSWYNRFLQSSQDGNIAVLFNRTTRSDAQLAPGYGPGDLPGNQFRLRIMDLLGVKYILDRTENPSDDKTFPIDRFKLVKRIDDWVIYENLKAAPRFFVTSDVRPYADTKDFESQFFDSRFDNAKTVLVSELDFHSLPKFVRPSRPNTARLVSYKPTKIEITVSPEIPQFLFISDTFDNGWTATVNGKPTKTYRADFAFRGVVVPKGDSTVVFDYRPRSFQTGIAISIITLTAILIALIAAPIRKLVGKYQNKTSESPAGTSTARKL